MSDNVNHSLPDASPGELSRRDFIARTALATAAIACAGPGVIGQSREPAFAWKERKAVNPLIDNLRVVCGVNTAMITGNPVEWDMQSQNAPVDRAQVSRTLDAMACSLAGTTEAADAWKTILRKPDSKNWNAVRAAIKVNCIAKNHPRLAVVEKVCLELNRLGVTYGNVIIYDGTHNAISLYKAFSGTALPAGVVISDKNGALGGTTKIAIPAPKPGKYKCSRLIAEGGIDILVNIAVNKGHDASLGKTTLTLKNHAGTFEPMPIHTGGGLDYILAFNKSDAFWGGSPVRQQLCIVDSLWASVQGPFATPDTRLDRLIMGTFAGAVDYLTVKKIREPLMKADHANVERFVTEFGYTEKEMGDLITVQL